MVAPMEQVQTGDAHEALLDEAGRRMTAMFRVLRRAKQLLGERLPPEVVKMGEGQYRALHALCQAGQMTAGDLADECDVADPTISKLLNGLESSGLVVRQTNPKNRREVLVILTPAGRAMHDKMLAHLQQGLAQVLRSLNDDQLRDLLVAFGHLERLAEREAWDTAHNN